MMAYGHIKVKSTAGCRHAHSYDMIVEGMRLAGMPEA